MSLADSALDEGLPFGRRVRGVSREVLADADHRRWLNALFDRYGLIVFEGVEPTAEMQVQLSDVFGPLQEHVVATVPRVDENALPGVIDMHTRAGQVKVVEIDGERLAGWLPWHFDHCYNDKLNRAGVLRAVESPPSGGLTCFCDGIDLYQRFDPDLRTQIEGRKIIYKLSLDFAAMRFGRPETLRSLFTPEKTFEIMAGAKALPRALHPAVWTRDTGEKVLHVSPWMAQGVSGDETDAGDALLEAVCQEVSRKARAYRHSWRPGDMLIWDNWRMLHAVSGWDPQFDRRMQRTTIKGDYGLGAFENGGHGDPLLTMTV
jgi:taurine dioxygenase